MAFEGAKDSRPASDTKAKHQNLRSGPRSGRSNGNNYRPLCGPPPPRCTSTSQLPRTSRSRADLRQMALVVAVRHACGFTSFGRSYWSQKDAKDTLRILDAPGLGRTNRSPNRHS